MILRERARAPPDSSLYPNLTPSAGHSHFVTWQLYGIINVKGKSKFEMKALGRYANNMDKRRYLYCSAILELMKRGHRYRESKDMLAYSKLLEKSTDKEYGWLMFHNMGVKDWADIAEDGERFRKNAQPRRQMSETEIVERMSKLLSPDEADAFGGFMDAEEARKASL